MPKHIVALALLLSGFVSALWLMFAAGSGALVDHSIENSRRFLADFQTTTRFVRTFHTTRGRLPSNEELGGWSQANLRSGEPLILIPDDGQYGEDAVAAVGRPPRGGYLLGMWRGEWMEYYAPWSGQSTLSFDRGAYYLLGGQLMDVWVSGLLALMSISGAWVVWKRRRSVTRLCERSFLTD